jgi:diguanylate cyclase (GGDEF)-like protein
VIYDETLKHLKTTDNSAGTRMDIVKQLGRFFAYMESKNRITNLFFGLFCACIVIYLDFIDAQEYQFAFFYLFPVGFTTWFAGQSFGLFIALFCSIAWTIDNHTHYTASLIWNSLSTIGIFVIISILVNKVRIMWEHEHQQSRRDFLTGFLNTRAFHEILDYELTRLTREAKPLSLAYFDLDNFKQINDMFGHLQGDELLKCIASSLSGCLRKTDVIARIGGDEFVILLPATDQEAVKIAIHKILESLQIGLRKSHWTSTFSMGVITCLEAPSSSEELISMADHMMYDVKHAGKNNIKFSTYPSTN